MANGAGITQVAVIGAGVVGRGWIPVFVGGGCDTRIFDIDPAHSKRALAWSKAFLSRQVKLGALTVSEANDRAGRIRVCETMEEAVADAQYVQESVPEHLTIKRELFAELDEITGPQVILASSTSSMDIEELVTEVSISNRCVTAHPFNPAAVLPVVEVLATRNADEAFIDRVVAFLKDLGQTPVRMHKFVRGYIGNRLQLALMREAFDIVENRIASTEAVDTVLSEALALRWALLGTFGTNHTNSDQGIRGYYHAFGPTLKALMDDLTARSPVFDAGMIEKMGNELDHRFEDIDVGRLSDWRDDFVGQLRALKRSHKQPT